MSDIQLQELASSPSKKSKSARLVPILASIALVLTYVSALFLGGTKVEFSTETRRSSLDTAISNYKLNDASSTTVYQQMVTNGWVTKDLLRTIGDQNVSIINNQVATAKLISATNTLITFGLGMIGIIGVATLLARRRRN